jgi:ubiquinone/menaquinone biosynthesis C-methylase UbiE
VMTVLSDPDDPLLQDASVDRFVIVNTWHHVEDQPKYLGLLRRMLKPGGRVVHIDFHKRDLPVGPPLGMKVAREDVVKQMEAAGFRLATEHGFLPYQYFLVFEVR